MLTPDGKPVFVEFDDGSGLLTHRYKNEWRIWSDPLSNLSEAPARTIEFATESFNNKDIKELWCDDISDKIYPKLKNSFEKDFILSPLEPAVHPATEENFLSYYHLFWPVLNIEKYDPSLPGGHFKEMRNARSKFYREHKVNILNASELNPGELLRIVDDWLREVTKKEKEDVYDLKYRVLIKNNFRGFNTARAMIVDGKPVGFNAGYEVPNNPERFAGIIGLHDYSIKDLGDILWLEDLEWIKNAGYKEMDMQGMEYEWEIKTKTKFGAVIERVTDTFSVKKKSHT